GEEFFIIMPNCTPHQASVVAERIRSSLEKDMTSGHKITASLGISTYGFSKGPEEPLDEILEKLIEQSDQALYQAKDKGKNRVQHFSSI
ncbi:MAG TPA: GGDEF domain-containing protein, partial [Anaerolineales bacterium]|nr:GGDEF domain-containing protein [Anaerolineales bacterium]